MEKQTAIKLLGGTPKLASEAMGYLSVQAIYMWSDPLKPEVADRVRGVVARMNEDARRAKQPKATA